jgi:hypothetical protein
MIVRVMWAGALGVVALALAAGCSSSDQSSTQMPPAEAAAVVGTAECLITERTVEGDVMLERFECTVQMSDPRVTGSETLTAVTRLASDTADVWTVEDAVLTTSEGTWRGEGRGVVDYVGVLPSAEGTWPYNYGEMLYVGEGDYAGLEFQNFISASNAGGAYAGWIAPTG